MAHTCVGFAKNLSISIVHKYWQEYIVIIKNTVDIGDLV